MPTVSFSSSYGIQQKSVLNLQDFKTNYLFGVSLKDDKGKEMPDSVIENAILEAIDELENLLSVKLKLQVITENRNMYSEDWLKWGFIKTTWPIVCTKSLIGQLGNLQHLSYPKEWLSARRVSDGRSYGRNFYIVPFSSTPFVNHVMFTSSLYSSWWRSNGTIPNYWEISYITGFKELPGDIKSVLSKYVAIRILTQGGQSVVNKLRAGVGSTSISLDGLSQSVSPMASSSAGPYGSVIKQYVEDLKTAIPNLRDFYTAINLAVC
jgi:hypothetical protein